MNAATKSYVKTTTKSRRAEEAARTVRLTEALAAQGKAGYVSRSSRNQINDATKTKGTPFSKCRAARFITPRAEIPGYVLIHNKADASAKLHLLEAKYAARYIPEALHSTMGIASTDVF